MIDEKINSKERDYDKEPIVIEDYNPMIIYNSVKFLLILGIAIILFNPMEITIDRLIGGMIMLLIIVYPVYNNFSKLSKRYIILSEHDISVQDSNNNLIYKINLDNINLVQKTYEPYYTYKQSLSHFSELRKFIGYILAIILVPLKILETIIRVLYKKILFYIKFRNIYFNIFDSIVFTAVNNSEIINILIPNHELHEDIDSYLKSKLSIQINKLKINLMFFYIDDIK